MIILVFILFTLSCASANDDIVSDVESPDEDVGNFTELNLEILDADDNVDLTKDHSSISDEDDINLTKSIRINGYDHELDFNNESEAIIVNDNVNVIFDNVTFKNIGNDTFKFVENSTFNLTFINCEFINHYTYENNITVDMQSIHGTYSCEITSEIINLAKKIVGDSSDIEAAKKLANWVNKNINHETREGFYQSPSETLHRRMGNCCSHSELFLQMCEAIGITKNHTLGFVHSGNLEFGKRHFFVLFDNICVDTDGGFKNPWNHAKLTGGSVYQVTLYPNLPVKRTY